MAYIELLSASDRKKNDIHTTSGMRSSSTNQTNLCSFQLKTKCSPNKEEIEMKTISTTPLAMVQWLSALCALALLSPCESSNAATANEQNLSKIKTATNVTVSVYAAGLNNPRGLKFGPGGDLYVAEGGTGGVNSTDPMTCTQVLP